MTKKRKLDKAQCQWIHAKRRIFQRYGLRVNRVDRIKMVEMIQHGHTECIKVLTTRVSLHLVDYQTPMYLVYDKQRKMIVTALTKQMVDKTVYEAPDEIMKRLQTENISRERRFSS